MSSKGSSNSWVPHTPVTATLALVLLPIAVCGAVPFSAALDSAAIVQDRCDDLLDRSAILGNGDINAQPGL